MKMFEQTSEDVIDLIMDMDFETETLHTIERKRKKFDGKNIVAVYLIEEIIELISEKIIKFKGLNCDYYIKENRITDITIYPREESEMKNSGFQANAEDWFWFVVKDRAKINRLLMIHKLSGDKDE